MNMNEMKKYFNAVTLTVFIIAFLLGYGVSSRIINRESPGGVGSQETAQMPETTGGEAKPESALADISASTTEEANTISADDQPAGTMVAVAVKLEKEAWVAVHEDANGKLGNILGAQFFPAGTHLGKIDLLRGTQAGKKYYVMLHSDDGNHTFDIKVDMPVKNAAGEPVMDAFMAAAGSATQ